MMNERVYRMEGAYGSIPLPEVINVRILLTVFQIRVFQMYLVGLD
jgi:hypothetical protein